VFHSYGLTPAESTPIVEALSKHPKKWVDFMMRFELGLEKPDPKRAFVSALTIALSYIAGGLIPLAPYIVAAYLHRISVATALLISVGLTVLALMVFGFIKGRFTGTRPLRSALQTALIGSLAAGAAFLIARAIS
jgi:vacuolar iron transporter family protein